MTDHEKLLAMQEKLAVTQAALCEAAALLRGLAEPLYEIGWKRSATAAIRESGRFTRIGEDK